MYKDLLNTSDVLDLLTNKLKFTPKQVGRSIFFLCPFHSDKNPSLSFEPNRKLFTCFSCGFKANDIFSFWAQYKKISLEEAAKAISQIGYFPLSILQAKEKQEQKKKNETFDLISLVTDIYQHNLFTKFGKATLKYLENSRKINDELINRFFLGCSVGNKQIIDLFFKNSKSSLHELLSVNLVRLNNDGEAYDFFFSQQLIIPLSNAGGRIIAFASREIVRTVEREKKYKFLPSHRNYHKSSLLYNYHIVKASQNKECYLVEGFFDVISLTKLGVENCIALLGTNLSEEQIKLISKLKKKIIFFLDGDEVGQTVTVSAMVKLLYNEIDCEAIKPIYQNDPDEICQQSDKMTIWNTLQQRENPYWFILNHYFTKWEIKENPQRISWFIDEIAQTFQKFKTNTHDFLIKKISSLTNWKKEAIEPYFILQKFPVLNFYRFKAIYYHCKRVIREKEKLIIFLCIKERKIWLIVAKRKYYFLDKFERNNYYKIYNRYTTLPSNDRGPNNNEIKNSSILFSNCQIITNFLQEINNIKKFMHIL